MAKRPRLKIALGKADKMLEWLGTFILAILWIGTITGYSTLPEQIPGHFNASGKVDSFTGKASIFILPIIATVVYIGLTILSRFPHVYNYPVVVTEDDARRLYAASTRLLRVLNLIVLIIIFAIVSAIYTTASSGHNYFANWLLPVIITLFVAFTILSITSGFKNFNK